MNNYSTIENTKRFTIGKLKCTIVPATHESNADTLVLSHEDYDFDCILSNHGFSEYKPKETSGLYVHHKDKDAVLKELNLTYHQGYTVRDAVNSTRKYGDTQHIVEPRKVNLRTVTSSRFEKFANEWFEFLNTIEWLEWCKEAHSMVDNVNSANTAISAIVDATNNSTVINGDRETEIRNDFGRLSFEDATPTPTLTVGTYGMTTAQKEELFIFLDKMSYKK